MIMMRTMRKMRERSKRRRLLYMKGTILISLSNRKHLCGCYKIHQKVPDARKTRGSQDLTGMTLAKIPNKGEEVVETL